MKKLFAIFAVAAVMASCASGDADKAAGGDTSKKEGTPAAPVQDTTKKDTGSMAPKADTGAAKTMAKDTTAKK